MTEDLHEKLTAAFEERADYIDTASLEEWHVENELSKELLKKLIGPGAKLLVGPRGCGKTHHMRIAEERCLASRGMPVPVFVSFNRYYHLEPLLHRSPNAFKVFHTWVLARILMGASVTAKKLDLSLDKSLPVPEPRLEDFVARAEKRIEEDADLEIISTVTVNATCRVLLDLADMAKRTRCVLLLDDAALTLTPEYMTEFFDIVRSVKDRRISPKASVYPGTTEYGPRFHVGQDAESVPAWLNVDHGTYSDFMDSLLSRRLSDASDIPKDFVEIFKYASFGIPRVFIGLLGGYIDTRGNTPQSRFNKVMEERSQLITTEYKSLAKKMPHYRTIIETGWTFFIKTVDLLAKENTNDLAQKNINLGISGPYDHKLDRMMQFLIEAGILFEHTPVKHGDGREYRRYIPHLLFLINKRAFSYGRGFKPDATINALRKPNAKHPVRRSFASILGEKEIKSLHLDSPPCQKCGATRISDDQRFCHNCGAELSSASAFEDCMKISIDELPIPDFMKKRIGEDTKLKTIGDFYMLQDPATRLREARQIGPKRGSKIYNAAKRFVEEYLER